MQQEKSLTPTYTLGALLGILIFLLMRRLFNNGNQMPYPLTPLKDMKGLELQHRESLSWGIKRMAQEQVDTALHLLINLKQDPDENIHEARKCLKKARAVLRLVRDEIGKDSFQQENTCYRDASRLLSAVRDSAVMVETLDKLCQNDELPPVDRLRQKLVAMHEDFRRQVIYVDKAPQQVIHILESARERVQDLPIQHDDFSALHGGLGRVYQRGWNALKNAYTDPTTENFHEWRKRVKYLRYQMQILNLLWADLLSDYAEALHGLSDVLGDEHDLAELRNLVIENPQLFKNMQEQDALLNAITTRRMELQTAARPLGERLYAETPDAFIQRIAGYRKAYITT